MLGCSVDIFAVSKGQSVLSVQRKSSYLIPRSSCCSWSHPDELWGGRRSAFGRGADPSLQMDELTRSKVWPFTSSRENWEHRQNLWRGSCKTEAQFCSKSLGKGQGLKMLSADYPIWSICSNDTFYLQG